MKKTIKISLIVLSIFLVCGCSNDKKEKSNEILNNTDENVIKDQTLEVFEFTNTKLTYKNGISILETTITNTGENTEYLKEFKIHFKKKEKEVVVITGYVGSSLNPNEKKIIKSNTSINLMDVDSISYEIIK